MGQLQNIVGLRQLLDAAGVHPSSALGKVVQAAGLAGKVRPLQQVVRLLELHASQKAMAKRLFAVPQEHQGQGLAMGKATDGLDVGGVVLLDPRRHTLIAGTTGSGKSVLNTFLVGQHLHLGGRAWVFDLEREFGCLAAAVARDRLWVLGKQQLLLNPLQPPHGIAVQAWMVVLVELLRAIYFMKDGGASLARLTLQELYERCGCYHATGRWPQVGEWLQLLRQKKFAVTSQFQGHLETLTRVVTTVVDLFPLLDHGRALPLEELTKRSVIFDVAGWTSQDIEFLVCLLLHVPEVDALPVPRLVVIEECHVMLNPQRAVRSDLGESPLQDALRRQRKASRSFVLVDQTVCELPGSVIANVGNVVTFSLRNAKCQAVLGAALGLTKEQKEVLMKLPPRMAVVHIGACPDSLLVQIPELSLPAALPAMVIEHEMAEQLRAWWPRRQSKEHAGDGVSGSPRNASPRSAAFGDERPEDGQKRRNVQSTTVSLACLKYLEAWNEERHMLLPVTQFDRLLGYGLAEGHGLRAEAVEAGLLAVCRVRTGGRGSGVKVVTITEEGYAALRELGVQPCMPRGKGKVESQFWQYAIVRHVQKAEPMAVVTIEGRRGTEGKAADVVAELDGKAVAYEVQLSGAKHVTENVVKDLLAGFDEVVVGVLTERERKVVEKLSARGATLFETQDELARVRSVLLREFLAREEE